MVACNGRVRLRGTVTYETDSVAPITAGGLGKREKIFQTSQRH
jgi:hypothetical protein